jgi:preprotein translocase subunit SecA
MIAPFFRKLFGSRNDRLLKQYQLTVKQINALEPQIKALSDKDLAAKTADFKQRLSQGTSLDSLLPEAFAVCREASFRVLNMRHFDVQLLGGMALHYGQIAEMRTGEGKTLVATLAVYLNALSGNGVHVITVNDYLAERDARQMEKLYQFLGLSVGINLSQMPHELKQAAYAADITYGTNNEFGFDYLRDNMVFSVGEKVQRQLNFTVIDEVDSILIDEARTPLIISGPSENSIDVYQTVDLIPAQLHRQTSEEGEGDYWVDEKGNSVHLSEQGHENAERIMQELGLLKEGESLYSSANIRLMHHLVAALRAHVLFIKNQHYVIEDGEIVIVDEFSGRKMQGRRWSEGLHQAIEAKEGVTINRENQTMASITFQNYFRLYNKLSGMTGTADTEAFEFQSIYGLETVVIPTNRPMQRVDQHDKVYRTAKEKYGAILLDVQDCFKRGQPVLVGTTSIENSEVLSELLTKAGLPHNVLNAKEHEREAEIIVQAGRPKAITVATNMAGRGTDIVLGGNHKPRLSQIEADASLAPAKKAELIALTQKAWEEHHVEVLAAGGLHIIGTERHESRRVDNQLRGRSGRQGDAGSSAFYLCLEDSLLRIFAADRVNRVMEMLKLPEGEAITAPMVTRSIEGAQKKVEARNFEIRKQLLDYDDVSNEQRKVIYTQRNEILESEDVSNLGVNMRESLISETVDAYMPPDSMEEQWDVAALQAIVEGEYRLEAPIADWIAADRTLDGSGIKARLADLSTAAYAQKETVVGVENMRHFEKNLLLNVMDTHWREHLTSLDQLRQGIHLRGYAQKNPKQEYKREAFELFSDMLDRVKKNVAGVLMTVEIRTPDAEQAQTQLESTEGVDFSHVGRNDPCPCGSGKRFKECHGKLK